MLQRVVDVVQIAALVCVGIFVVMLFTNEPTSRDSTAAPTEEDGAVDEEVVINGAAVFEVMCASCHGDDGQGGVGPQLAGGAVVEAFPDPADQIAFVTDGGGGMPAFGDELLPEEIAAVVEYTRTDLPG